MASRSIVLALAAAAALSAGNATAREGALEPIGPDELAFSVDNLDTSVDPAEDFYRYAAGGWIDRVERPEAVPALGFSSIINERLLAQLLVTVQEAGENADAAPRGSALRQIGKLYESYMDVDAIEAAGVEPIRAELARIAAIANESELGAYLAHFTTITGHWPLLEVEIFGSLDDSAVNAVYVSAGTPGLTLGSIYEMPADAAPKRLYADYIAGLLAVAGYEVDRAPDIARTVVAMESALQEGALDPVLKVDIRNMNNPRSFDELQSGVPELAFDDFFTGVGMSKPARVILTDPDYPAALSGVIRRYSLGDFKDYFSYRLIQRFAGVMGTDFEQPGLALNEALMGVGELPPREERALRLLQGTLGQPLGKVYVDNFFEAGTQARALDMIERLQAAFRSRIERNEWLSDATRAEALDKVDKLYYRIGIPDEWIDYSDVDIGDDIVPSLMNASAFAVRRETAKQGEPVEHRAFADPTHTLPTIVNAGYDPGINGFEVTAAITQPPAFQEDMDAPVYYCRLGAVIGHEMTHGFDSGGRNFDAEGNLRNWWTDADAARFDAEAGKLVAQADRFEALPERFLDGALSVKENMADVGGITLAHDALMDHLAEHPEEDVVIDGFTPSQRCFLAWAQLWAEKASEQAIQAQLEDYHPPNAYRAVAPLQHLDAFHEAFGIEADDPEWLPPEERIRAW